MFQLIANGGVVESVRGPFRDSLVREEFPSSISFDAWRRGAAGAEKFPRDSQTPEVAEVHGEIRGIVSVAQGRIIV